MSKFDQFPTAREAFARMRGAAGAVPTFQTRQGIVSCSRPLAGHTLFVLEHAIAEANFAPTVTITEDQTGAGLLIAAKWVSETSFLVTVSNGAALADDVDFCVMVDRFIPS